MHRSLCALGRREGFGHWPPRTRTRVRDGSGDGLVDEVPDGEPDKHYRRDGGTEQRAARAMPDRTARLHEQGRRRKQREGDGHLVPADRDQRPVRQLQQRLGKHVRPGLTCAAAHLCLGSEATEERRRLRVLRWRAGVRGGAPSPSLRLGLGLKFNLGHDERAGSRDVLIRDKRVRCIQIKAEARMPRHEVNVVSCFCQEREQLCCSPSRDKVRMRARWFARHEHAFRDLLTTARSAHIYSTQLVQNPVLSLRVGASQRS
mmetsp:Transcript_44240/g.96529  ORF Transcript_44240/g.96529 Transcript_44240/m.96529 type:complete len:260 (+) Transcript_44240:269-1048(+)